MIFFSVLSVNNAIMALNMDSDKVLSMYVAASQTIFQYGCTTKHAVKTTRKNTVIKPALIYYCLFPEM